ncbi:MFS transporter, partial [Streptomyces sp. T-3]|nr:MFS transporter [Streptomyces sp. T-3]
FIALGLAGHGVADSLAAFTAVRVLLGAGLTLGLVCLSVLAADCAKGRPPGGMFGSLEFVSKGGAVAAGLAAAAGNSLLGPTAPVLIGTAVALGTAAFVALRSLFHGPIPRSPRIRWSR